MKIILGSQSKGRREVLREMGFIFDVMSPDVDEKAIRSDNPHELTLALAFAKADVLIPQIFEPVLLITSDQVVVCNGKIREKPEGCEEAVMFLKSHDVYPSRTVTSVVVTNTFNGCQYFGTDFATIWFYPIPDEVIDQYIQTGDVFVQAGGFDHNHALLKPYVKCIDGELESVTGLPKTLTLDLIRQALLSPNSKGTR
ncbi:MAG: Maf family protein [Parcubacteria group bacterium]|nr:Maf family protein [Parcubacteria group bacterium]